MVVTTEQQDVGHCNHCGFEWSLHLARATRPALASVSPDQFGDRCPFCRSNNVTVTKEDGIQTLST